MRALAHQRLLDTGGVCAQLAISARTFRRLVQRRELGVVRIGGTIRIPEAELEAFLRRRYAPALLERKPIPAATVEQLFDRIVGSKNPEGAAQ